MILPLWALFGMMAAALSAVIMLVQERFKVHGFAIAFWNKVACLAFALPVALYLGLPDQPLFYVYVLISAMLWAVSDVIFFGAVARSGAGVISRLMPVSVILTFFLWFLFDPALLGDYLQTPVRSALVVATLCASMAFAMKLKSCPVSWDALRIVWFVIFAAVAGPIIYKLISQNADLQRGPFSYAAIEAAAMVTMWLIYYAIRKPVAREIMLAPSAIKAGFIIGFFSCLMIATNYVAITFVDNPGLLPAVKFTDTLIIMLFYKMTGRKETANVAAGLGLVACAAAIIILKSYGV